MKLKEGDIFAIPVLDGHCVGQIVKTPEKESLTVVVYQKLFKSIEESKILEEITSLNPLLFANTFDGRLYNKIWKIIANDKTVTNRIILPYYIIGDSPSYIEDFFKKRIRPASKDEAKKLVYRKYVAPVRIDNALVAYYKNENWNDELFSPLLYDYNLSSNKIVNDRR